LAEIQIINITRYGEKNGWEMVFKFENLLSRQFQIQMWRENYWHQSIRHGQKPNVSR
jgi:hypothetical protein